MYKNDDISIDKIRIVLNEEFMKLGEQIGEGSYGKIYKVNYTKENKIYVAKVVEIDLEEKILLDFTKREIDILYQSKCENLVKLIFYKIFKNGFLIIMEYADKGNLHRIVDGKKLSENQFFSIFKEIFFGVKYLHRNLIEHRDLKLENILVNSKNIIKICDFGLAYKLETLINDKGSVYNKEQVRYSKAATLGSPQCLSPEAIEQKSAPFGSVDIWSLGCIAYFLVFGFYPFQNSKSKDLDELKKNILNQNIKYNHRKGNEISDECIKFIQQLLEKNLEKRLDYKKIENSQYFKEKCKMIVDSRILINKVINYKFEEEPNINKGYESDETIVNKFVGITLQSKNQKNKYHKENIYDSFINDLNNKYNNNFKSIIPYGDAIKILEKEYQERVSNIEKNKPVNSNDNGNSQLNDGIKVSNGLGKKLIKFSLCNK